MKQLAFFLAASVSLLASSSVVAQTSFPMITHTDPVAVQRGQTTTITVQGRMNFVDTYHALFDGEGIVGEIEKPKPTTSKRPVIRVKVKVKVSPDAKLGPREFRLVSKIGVSSLGQIVVVDDPVVPEARKNNTKPDAQSIKLPLVLTGRLEVDEDVDYFKFTAQAGEHLTFEMFCARLQDKIHDLQQHAKPMLVLYDDEGRELASNDHFYFADPLLSYTTKKSGTFYLQVRESTYEGDARWVYAIQATNEPHATHIYPLAVNPSKTTGVVAIGTAEKFGVKAKVVSPSGLGVHTLPLSLDNGERTNPVTVVVSDLPQLLEKESNDTPESATPMTVPCGINGRLGRTRDLDHFVFDAKKGQAIHFQVVARRFATDLNSTAHAVLDIMLPDGRILKSDYTSHGSEPSLVFNPTRDGKYVLRVRDLNSKGSPTSVYFVRANWVEQDFALRCDPDKAMIGPGSRTTWFVHLDRTNGFNGPVEVFVEGLPKGVTASKLTIPPSMEQGVIVVSADELAKHAFANVRIVGKGKLKIGGKEEWALRESTPNQELYFPGGGRGTLDVNMQTVVVTDPSDILNVKLDKDKVSLKPGQEVKIDFTIERNPNYTKNVTADVLLRHLGRVYGNPLPPGVTIIAGKSKTLLGKGTKGHIVLKAAANAAPIEDVPVAILANVSINFVVKIAYSSPVLRLSITRK
ncbi:MAG: pre-peptidase [Gemmataceae bacterium]